jgi:prevent-host-death family protein
MDSWSVAEAKAKLSEVIEKALDGAPQTITRNGKSAVVVVSAAEWQRRTERKGTLADFLADAPLGKAGAVTRRIRGKLRNADLG